MMTPQLEFIRAVLLAGCAALSVSILLEVAKHFWG